MRRGFLGGSAAIAAGECATMIAPMSAFAESESPKWGSWPDAIKKQWDPAMDLGDAGRAQIKGHDRQYYVDILHEVREEVLTEFKKRDDKWLLNAFADGDWGGPVNNLAKWFHVCEHEAHHTGQVAMMRKRLPGAKPGSEG